jgi:hypothetical protein
VAGCASSCLAAGTLDERRRKALLRRRAELNRALPLLTGAESAYFQRLDDLAAATLAALPPAGAQGRPP